MSEQKCVLAVMAHPDDIEFLCVGTLCRLHDLGWRVVMATMTAGDCGSATEDPEVIAATRRGEAEASARLLDADYHCLGALDLLVLFNEDMISRTVEVLRRAQPDVVITHSPQDYMQDHEQCSELVRAATFGAPIRNCNTHAASPAPILGHIPHFYYADPIEGMNILGERIQPQLRIDISGVIDRKERHLACHASQRDWLLKHHGIDEYLISMRRWSAERGHEAGVAYAEGFRQHLGHAYPHNDLLSELLG